MAIKSDNFVGVVLTDGDARAFEAQIQNSEPNRLGQRALERGLELLQGEGKPAAIEARRAR